MPLIKTNRMQLGAPGKKMLLGVGCVHGKRYLCLCVLRQDWLGGSFLLRCEQLRF